MLRVETPVWQIVLRGSAIYWLLFLLFRFVVRREIGAVGIADLPGPRAGRRRRAERDGWNYRTIGDGTVLILTLIGWNFAVDWVAYRVGWVRRFAEPRPLPLVRDGRVMRAISPAS